MPISLFDDEKLGRNQRLFLMWLNRYIESGKLSFPFDLDTDKITVNPLDFDPEVEYPRGLSMKPNWRHIAIGLAEHRLLDLEMRRDLTLVIYGKKWPDDYQSSLLPR